MGLEQFSREKFLFCSTLSLCADLIAGVKYQVDVSRRGPGSLLLTLGGVSVEAVVRGLNDGGLLDRKSVV